MAKQDMALPTDRAADPTGSNPQAVSSIASIPSARRRNWRGQFIKNLRETPEDSREWLIWSKYHRAWHRRSETGGACGYTDDIAHAGVFVRAKAYAYNDGDRNEAFHVSEKLGRIEAAIRLHEAALENLRYAQRIAARSDETQSGSAIGKSLVATPCAQSPSEDTE